MYLVSYKGSVPLRRSEKNLKIRKLKFAHRFVSMCSSMVKPLYEEIMNVQN